MHKKENLEKDEFSGYVDSLLSQTDQPTNDEIDDRFSLDNMSINETYSVDNAIDLLRDLPDVDQDVLATIVRKTLESANIDVKNIAHSAQAKEDKLCSDIEKMNKNIKALQNEIRLQKEQIEKMTESLNETRHVRSLLHQSFGAPDSTLDGEKRIDIRSDKSTVNLTDTGSFKVN